jgi:alkylated DNA repair dioxygenase AlkB
MTLSEVEQPASPVTVVRGFLNRDDANSLFIDLEAGPWDTLTNPRFKVTSLRKTVTYYEGDEAAANTYMNKFGEKGIKARPYSEAPQGLRDLRKILQEKYKDTADPAASPSFSLCYINHYKDRKTTIGWHRDREEETSPHKLVMVCLGASRTFSIWKIKERKEGEEKTEDWREETQCGDLVEMPVGFHAKGAYEHAVLPQKTFAGPRISLTFRSPDLSPNGPWAPTPPTLDPYTPDFLTADEAKKLLDASKKLLRKRSKTKYGADKRHMIGQSFADVDSKRLAYVSKDMPPKPIAEAPAAVQKMLAKLSERAGRTVNYACLVVYENEKDHMAWHQHKEDKGHDTPVFIVSVGAERTFGIREDKKLSTIHKFTAGSGSLITLPSEYNDTHKHAVLADKKTKGVRYAWNCKCVDELYSPQKSDLFDDLEEPAAPPAPKVWCCKAGHTYPPDAVYVGCKTVRGQKRDGSIFGNAVNPLKVRNKKSNPWVATDDKSFREYALKKMQEDVDFRDWVPPELIQIHHPFGIP